MTRKTIIMGIRLAAAAKAAAVALAVNSFVANRLLSIDHQMWQLTG